MAEDEGASPAPKDDIDDLAWQERSVFVSNLPDSHRTGGMVFGMVKRIGTVTSIRNGSSGAKNPHFCIISFLMPQSARVAAEMLRVPGPTIPPGLETSAVTPGHVEFARKRVGRAFQPKSNLPKERQAIVNAAPIVGPPRPPHDNGGGWSGASMDPSKQALPPRGGPMPPPGASGPPAPYGRDGGPGGYPMPPPPHGGPGGPYIPPYHDGPGGALPPMGGPPGPPRGGPPASGPGLGGPPGGPGLPHSDAYRSGPPSGSGSDYAPSSNGGGYPPYPISDPGYPHGPHHPPPPPSGYSGRSDTGLPAPYPAGGSGGPSRSGELSPHPRSASVYSTFSDAGSFNGGGRPPSPSRSNSNGQPSSYPPLAPPPPIGGGGVASAYPPSPSKHHFRADSATSFASSANGSGGGGGGAPLVRGSSFVDADASLHSRLRDAESRLAEERLASRLTTDQLADARRAAAVREAEHAAEVEALKREIEALRREESMDGLLERLMHGKDKAALTLALIENLAHRARTGNNGDGVPPPMPTGLDLDVLFAPPAIADKPSSFSDPSPSVLQSPSTTDPKSDKPLQHDNFGFTPSSKRQREPEAVHGSDRDDDDEDESAIAAAKLAELGGSPVPPPKKKGGEPREVGAIGERIGAGEGSDKRARLD